MVLADNFVFVLHQYIVMLLALFFVYYIWRDVAGKTYDQLNKTSLKTLVPIFIGFFIGIYFYLFNEWGTISIFLSFAFSLLITLSIFDPKYAVGFLVFLLISRPWEYFKNELMLSMLRDISILSVLSLLAHRIFRKQLYFQFNLATFFMVTYALWSFFSIIMNGQNNNSLNSYGLVFIKNIIVYLLVVNVVDKKEFILPIQTAFFLGVTEKMLFSFYNLYIVKKIGTEIVDERMTSIGLIENANDIAAVLILAIPFTFKFFDVFKNKFIRLSASFLTYTLYFLIIWHSKSRGATIGLGALAVTYYWLNVKNKKIATFVVVLGAFVTYFAMTSIQRKSDDVEGSTKNRIIFWKAGINMAVRNPLFGVGYDGYIRNLSRYANGNVGTDGAKMTIHSTWLLSLAETGFVGFFLFMGVWGIALKTAWRIKYIAPEFLLAIVSYGGAITFLSHTYMLYPYVLIALTVAAGQTINTNQKQVLVK